MTDISFKSDEITAHFPVNVLTRQYNNIETLNQRLSKVILGMEREFKNTPQNASKDGAIATAGGYQTSQRLNIFQLQNPEFLTLYQNIIEPAAKKYIEETFKEKSSQIRLSPLGWANVLRNGDWQRPHCHPTNGNLISGVYYVNVPEEQSPAGEIEFMNPLPISMHHGYSASKRIQPQAGKLLLFPPYHMHYVHPVKSSEPRIIIAFDISLAKNNLEFVF
ncbi:MAG: 2OG-Fe(II) oxygenase [Gammaproteobacteria bacterium]|nr:2OG-Fe(II) oxygenase [Gammaproteobacteria bacterium]